MAAPGALLALLNGHRNLRNLASVMLPPNGAEMPSHPILGLANLAVWNAVRNVLIEDPQRLRTIWISARYSANSNTHPINVADNFEVRPSLNNHLRFWFVRQHHPDILAAKTYIGNLLREYRHLYFETAKDLYFFLRCVEGVEQADAPHGAAHPPYHPAMVPFDNDDSLMDLVSSVHVADFTSGPIRFVRGAARLLQLCGSLQHLHIGVCYNCHDAGCEPDVLTQLATAKEAGLHFTTFEATRRWSACERCNGRREAPAFYWGHRLTARAQAEDRMWTGRRWVRPYAALPLLWQGAGATPLVEQPVSGRTRRGEPMFRRQPGRGRRQPEVVPQQLTRIMELPHIRALRDAYEAR